MRKMLNKKGFSLVELMIVVVIMGILIAVAIPLYGAITANSKNKTCATNIDNIQANVRNYYLGHSVTAQSPVDVKAMFDDGKMPECPWEETEGADSDQDDYDITVEEGGKSTVVCTVDGCANVAAAADDDGE